MGILYNCTKKSILFFYIVSISLNLRFNYNQYQKSYEFDLKSWGHMIIFYK